MGTYRWYPYTCKYSGNKYVVTGYDYWIACYDKDTGLPVSSLHTDYLNNGYFTRIRAIHTKKDTNLLIAETYNKLFFLTIPEFKLLNTVNKKFYYIEHISVNWEFLVAPHDIYSDNQCVFDIYKTETNELYYRDSTNSSNSNENNIYMMKFTDDGNYLIVISADIEYYITVFDVRNKKKLSSQSLGSKLVYNIDISNDSKNVLLSTNEGIIIYTLPELLFNKSINQNEEYIGEGIFSNDGSFIAILDSGEILSIYNIESGQSSKSFNIGQMVNNLPNSEIQSRKFQYTQISNDDNKLLFSTEGVNYQFDLEKDTINDAFCTHYTDLSHECTEIFFNNKDKQLVTCGPNQMMVWEPKTGKFNKSINLRYYNNSSNDYDIDTNGNLIMFKNKNIYFYNFKTQEYVKTITTRYFINFLSLSGNGKYLGYILQDSTFEIYDLENESIIYNGDLYTSNGYTPYGIEMSYDSLCIVISVKNDGVSDDFRNYLFNFITQKEIINSSSSGTCKFYKDEILFSSGDYGIHLSRAKKDPYNWWGTWKKISVPLKDFVITPNGKYIITSGPVIWDIETLDSIQLHADPELGDMDYLDISSDGKLLAAISEEGRIVVWDIEKYVTDVEENPIIANKEIISIFPNPASDYIEINFERCPTSPRCRTSERIEIYNVLGECVITIPETQTPNPRVDVSDLPVGIYFVRIGGFVGRFVKI
jgi:hypothetical protein